MGKTFSHTLNPQGTRGSRRDEMEGRWGMFDIRLFALKENIQIELPPSDSDFAAHFLASFKDSILVFMKQDQICLNLCQNSTKIMASLNHFANP